MECGVWGVVCGVLGVGCGVWCVVSGAWCVVCGVWGVGFGVRGSPCRVQGLGFGRHLYLTERMHNTVSLKSIHPQTRQLNFITRNGKNNVHAFVGELTLEKLFD